MGLIALLPEIDKKPDAVFVMHEKSEKHIPLHRHTKGQLSYVEGGVAYVTIDRKTYVVPARHYLWIPRNMPHILRVSHSATVLRSLFFYPAGDLKNDFYNRLGIYPANELLIQMINYSERWDGRHVDKKEENFSFFVTLKNLLPDFGHTPLSLVLPLTEDERLLRIIRYLHQHIDKPLSLYDVSVEFNMSERSISRLFQTNMHISFLQYLKTLRVIKAIELILKTNKTLSEIAFSLGYETLGGFSNTFHKFTNLRPSDLRKRQDG